MCSRDNVMFKEYEMLCLVRDPCSQSVVSNPMVTHVWLPKCYVSKFKKGTEHTRSTEEYTKSTICSKLVWADVVCRASCKKLVLQQLGFQERSQCLVMDRFETISGRRLHRMHTWNWYSQFLILASIISQCETSFPFAKPTPTPHLINQMMNNCLLATK